VVNWSSFIWHEKITALLIQLVTIFATWLIAYTVGNNGSTEASALLHFFVPLFAGAISLVFFLLFDWVIPRARLMVTTLFALANIFVGVSLR
jgi:hypothetical protein